MTRQAQIKRVAHFTQEIEDYLSPLGYFASSPQALSKKLGDGVKAVLRFVFSGSSHVTATCYYGVAVDAIEQELLSIELFKDSRSSWTVDNQTIFQRWDLMSRLYSVTNADTRIILNEPMGAFKADLKRFVGASEPVISNIDSLARYCLADSNLPLGHHAVRVPFVLAAAGRMVECDDYMSKVLSRGQFQNYFSFVNDFRKVEFRWTGRKLIV